MSKTGVNRAMICFCWMIIPVFFICFTNTVSQIQFNRPILFDDFNYNSIEYPIEGDSSGSIFGKNPWLTENGIVYTPAWRRYNRDNHTFGENASVNIEDYGFSLKMNKGFKKGTHGPMIVSGFYFTEGTYAAKVRFNKIKFDTQFIQAFWLNSPLYFQFHRGSELLSYWSELDFEFNNYFVSNDLISIQTGCNNKDGKNYIATSMDCICNDNNHQYFFPDCNGYYKGAQILAGHWFICLFNIDSTSKTAKFSMLCDSMSESGVKVWGGKLSEVGDWGKNFIITDYFPDYALTVYFSLHLGINSETASSNSKLDVDWFYYSRVPNLNFDDIKNDVDSLQVLGISKINTTGTSTFPDALSDEQGIIYIVGPDSISSCLPYTWKLKSTYQRHASFDMDFRYRFIDDEGPEEWVSVYRPDITLTARNYHKSLEIISSAFDYWGQYTTNDTMIIQIRQSDCDLESKFLVSEPHPNPALLAVQLDYELMEPADVKISIYDLLGQKIESLVDRRQDRGHYNVIFDANNCSTGLYVCVIQIGKEMLTKKIEIYKGSW